MKRVLPRAAALALLLFIAGCAHKPVQQPAPAAPAPSDKQHIGFSQSCPQGQHLDPNGAGCVKDK